VDRKHILNEIMDNSVLYIDKMLHKRLSEENSELLKCEMGKLLKVFNNDPNDDASIDLQKTINYVITLGGDGTILWASKQFWTSFIPPIVAFSHGSLGYLCNFDMQEYPVVLSTIFFNSVLVDQWEPHIDYRMRLSVGVVEEPVRKIYIGNDLANPIERKV
jgi:NAD kinase